MTQRRSNPEDLSARARRGLLSEGEELELERELLGNPALRAAHAVGVDLDRSSAVRAGDEALISRAADASLARVRRSGLSSNGASDNRGEFRASPKRRRTLAVLLSAALLFVTGMAAAFWSGVVPARWFGRMEKTEETHFPESNAARNHPASGVARQAPPADVAPSGETPPLSPVESGADLSTRTRGDDVGIAPRAPSVRTYPSTPSGVPQRLGYFAASSTEVSVATLFRTANAARREGDFERAKRAYTELIARYPTSDEARLSRVSLGKLLLAKGNPSDAEQEFAQYLKGGHGELAEEALVSRAQSLQKLGRSDAERLTWRRLLAEYPSSVYSAEAKARLDALRRGASPSP